MTDFLPFNATTHPIVKLEDDHNNWLDHAFEKAASYIVRVNGVYYEAIKGGTSSGAGTIVYGGLDNIGGVDGTDASAVLQAIVTAMVGGGVLFIKAGEYNLTIGILIAPNTTGLNIIGEKSTKLIYPDDTDELHVFYTATSGTGTYNHITISNLEFDGNSSGVTEPESYEDADKLCPIYLHNVSYVNIHDCYFHDYYGYAIVIQHTGEVAVKHGAWLKNNYIYNAGNSEHNFHSGGGIYSNNLGTIIEGNFLNLFYGTGLCIDESNGHIINNNIYNQGIGGEYDYPIVTGFGAHDVLIDGNYIYDCHNQAIINKIGGDDPCPRHIITNNMINSQYGLYSAIHVKDTGHIISNNTILNWGIHEDADYADGIRVEDGADAIVTNNYISNVYRHGITVVGTAMVQGNYCDATGGHADASGIIFSGASAAAYGAVSGNYCTGTYASVYFFGVTDSFYVVDNEFDANPAVYGATVHLKNNKNWVTENEGAATNVSDGGTIAHGLFGTPTNAIVQTTASNEFASVTAMDATDLTVVIKKHDGTAGTQQTIYWYAAKRTYS